MTTHTTPLATLTTTPTPAPPAPAPVLSAEELPGWVEVLAGLPVVPLAVLAVALLAAGYALTCWVRPVTPCRACDGNGRIRTPSGRAWLRCTTCDGVGARIRTGRRAFNTTRRVHHDAAHLSHHDQAQRHTRIPTTPEHQPTTRRRTGDR